MITLNHVTKIYVDDKNVPITALQDVNIVFPEVGLVIINGTSGCGKTTLLNVLGGLDSPTKGEILFDNVRIDNQDEKWWDTFRGCNIGFIYQNYNLLTSMTVRENVQLPLTLQKLDEETSQNRLNTVIHELGLTDYLDKKAGVLSGGQKQRVAIARALVTGAKIILADEPTGNLDKQNSENVFRLLKEIAKNRLVIAVTHDYMIANAYADRLIQISYGKIESDSINEDYHIDAKNEHQNKRNNPLFNESLTPEEPPRTLSYISCLKFSLEAIRQRKMRCVVSVIIFCITILLILVLCQAVFRNDSASITAYLVNSNQKVLSLFTDVPDEYSSLTEADQITTGKKIYDTISQSIDESRIIRVGGSYMVEDESGNYQECNALYVDQKSEKYFCLKEFFQARAMKL